MFLINFLLVVLITVLVLYWGFVLFVEFPLRVTSALIERILK